MSVINNNILGYVCYTFYDWNVEVICQALHLVQLVNAPNYGLSGRMKVVTSSASRRGRA